MKAQFSSVTQLCQTECNTPDFPVHHQLLELTLTHVHRVGDAIQPSHLLLSPPPAFSLSQHQGLFQWVSSLHQVAKYWSFSFCISPSSECSGLISFRMDWLSFLAVQGTLKSLLQHHTSKASILRHSAFFNFGMLSGMFFSQTMLALRECFSCVWLFATLWAVAYQAPLSIGFSRQDYWSGLPCPPLEDLPNPGIESVSPALQADSLPLSHQGILNGLAQFSPVQFSHSVMSDSSWLHGL